MAYRIEIDESVAEGFRRCAEEQLDRAIGELTDGVKVDPVEAVHDARKALKMERALLRLGRAGMRRETRRRANADLRAIGQRLSDTRDADVMIEALRGLSERYVGQVPEHTFAAVQARLEADRDALRTSSAATGAVEGAVEELRALRAAGEIRLRGNGWGSIEPGLRRAYTLGRRAMKAARREPTVENLHEWRKRVKDVWYHLRLIEPAAPLTLGGAVQEAHALSDLLGDDHDLAVLRDRVNEIAGDVAVDHEPLLELLDHRRRELQAQARLAGTRVYAERPGAFSRRLERYWRASRSSRSSAQELMQ